MLKKTATIQDVAREAGVSAATVSRALTSPGVVAKSTRGAVMKAVQSTGYRVNPTARNLRQQRTGSVIALVPNLANPFFSQILAGMAATLTPEGYGLLVADTQTGPDADDRLTHYLHSGLADGLMILDGTLSPECLDTRNRPPVIAVCEWIGADLPSVRVENADGAGMAVRHLAEAGHTRIAHITGPRGNVLTETRLQGFQAALAALGLPCREDWIFEGDFSMDSGALAAQQWRDLTDRPSAVFCSSDEMACGFMGALQHHGIDVPRDISVVGFDNIEVGGHLTPALTTIRQPRRLIGERAARHLLDMIERRDLTGPTEIIPVELIRRSSVTTPAPR